MTEIGWGSFLLGALFGWFCGFVTKGLSSRLPFGMEEKITSELKQSGRVNVTIGVYGGDGPDSNDDVEPEVPIFPAENWREN